jgi:dienelactone hydrolase
MAETTRPTTAAPTGDLAMYDEQSFTSGGATHRVFRRGAGPAVIVIPEMPGISPMVLGFADRVVALGCTAIVPDLFGRAGRDPLAGNQLAAKARSAGTIIRTCVRREFTAFAAGGSSPVVDWLRALAHDEHTRCGGPGVGVVGMCFTGGFALAMAVDEAVLAPVLSQPSLPLPISSRHKGSIDVSDEALDVVAGRCAGDGLRVLGLRFDGDPFVPPERFEYLRRRLGDGFVAVELDQAHGNPNGPLAHRHSVLTGDLIDEPGEPTRAALEQVLDLLRSRLLAS